MPYEKKPGEAVAWNPKADKHPLSIKCTAHRAIAEGEEFEVAIWRNAAKEKDTQPDWSGKVQDKWVPTNAPQRSSDRTSRAEYNAREGKGMQTAADVVDDFDSDIPW